VVPLQIIGALAFALGKKPEGSSREERHMAESSPVPPVSTFVVRFWQEWSVAGPRWRGRIEHVQSGESIAFLNWDGMLDFIRRFGAMSDDESWPAKKDEAGGRGTITG
jgi:hypothetical protein